MLFQEIFQKIKKTTKKFVYQIIKLNEFSTTNKN